MKQIVKIKLKRTKEKLLVIFNYIKKSRKNLIMNYILGVVLLNKFNIIKSLG